MIPPSRVVISAILVSLLAGFFSGPVAAQRSPLDKGNMPPMAAFPSPYCLAMHDAGQLNIGLTNYGKIGVGRGRGSFGIDCFTGGLALLGEYPKGSNTTYLYKGALWIGAIRGKDTLVSVGNEFNSTAQEFHPITPMQRRSLAEEQFERNTDRVSDQDMIATYVDTFTSGVPFPSFDALDNRPHKPLGLRVDQRSFVWTSAHADDFIIVEYTIRNIGRDPLRDVYVGIYWDGDVHPGQRNPNIPPDPFGGKGYTEGVDDLTGFLYSTPRDYGECTFRDTLLLAWIADNDGDIEDGRFRVGSAVGVRFLSTLLRTSPKVSYNWYVYNYNPVDDYGPQQYRNRRNMGNGTGTPYGDRSKYHLLSRGEIDFNQIFAYEIGPFDPLWVQPTPSFARRLVRGADVQFVLSIGPYQMPPGGVLTVPVALVGGENFHDFFNNYLFYLGARYNPDEYLSNLDFSELVANAVTADKVYDIPGVDTDGDGYRGSYRLCGDDTLFYRGDGFPDLVAAEPPPPPRFWLEPTLGGLRVRINGARSETARDVFSGKLDFEGYRVYLARDTREESYSLVAQYDRPNYDKFVYTVERRNARFLQFDDPFTLEELRCLYGRGTDPCYDSTFDPLAFSVDYPFIHPEFDDSVFYFAPHEYNTSEWGVTTPIRRIYPDQPAPSSLENPLPEELTEDGYLKYYEYEVIIEDLLPTVPYYVVVTAFDFGEPASGLAPLESSKTLFARSAYADNQWDRRPDEVGNVYVFPNPYRQDAGYRTDGFEGRGQEDRTRNRVRKVTFANLPPRCTISIYTLDGDLVKRIEHDFHPTDPNSSYHEWDLVTRNIQIIVSGLYYWTVEDDRGRVQIGKLAVLL